MAKEEKKPETKSPEVGSGLFHNIMKASVKGNPKPKVKKEKK